MAKNSKILFEHIDFLEPNIFDWWKSWNNNGGSFFNWANFINYETIDRGGNL